jgi:hypothetical protein
MALSTRAQLRELYFGESSYALRFQAMWIIFDQSVIAFFIVAPFVPHNAVFYAFDYLIAILLLADMVLRAWTYGDIKRWLKRPLFWADLAVLLSLVLPFYGINLGFLRALRAYSLVQEAAFWRVIAGGRYRDTPVADTAKAAVNLLVFVFVMAGSYTAFRCAGGGHRLLHRLALFHRHHADHHGLWRHCAARRGRPPDLDPHHDRRRLAVLSSDSARHAPEQGAPSLPRLRAGAARLRCRALQGLRRTDLHYRRE